MRFAELCWAIRVFWCLWRGHSKRPFRASPAHEAGQEVRFCSRCGMGGWREPGVVVWHEIASGKKASHASDEKTPHDPS